MKRKKKPFRWPTMGIAAVALGVSLLNKIGNPHSDSMIVYLMVWMVAIQMEQRYNDDKN